MTPGETLLRGLLAALDLPVKGTYTVEEVCRLLAVSRNTVKRLCYDGKLPSMMIRTSRRIPFPSLATYLATHLPENLR